MEESRGRGCGGGHIPPGGPGLRLATSPGCPAARRPPPRPGQTGSRPTQPFFGAWPAPAHNPGSSCLDPPRPPTHFLLGAMTVGFGFSHPLPLYSACHSHGSPPSGPGSPGSPLAGPVCGQRAIGWASDAPWHLSHPLASVLLLLPSIWAVPLPSCLPMSKALEVSP